MLKLFPSSIRIVEVHDPNKLVLNGTRRIRMFLGLLDPDPDPNNQAKTVPVRKTLIPTIFDFFMTFYNFLSLKNDVKWPSTRWTPTPYTWPTSSPSP